MTKAAVVVKAPTKTDIISKMAEASGITKKQAGEALAALQDMASSSLKKGGVFMIPGFVKLKVTIKPATKERKGINPFTKEETVFKAKPASKAVKVIAMKALKDSI